MKPVTSDTKWKPASFSRETLIVGTLFFVFVWLEFSLGLFNISEVVGSVLGISIPSDMASLISYAIMAISGVLIFWKYLFAELEKDDSFWKNMRWSLAIYAVAFMAAIGISWILSLLTSVQDSNQSSVDSASLLFQVVGACMLAPIAEELYFRFFLYRTLREHSRVLAVIISSTLFALWHTAAAIFIAGDATQLLSTLPYLPLGIAFALTYEKTQNIKYPILLHIASNSISTLMLFMGA